MKKKVKTMAKGQRKTVGRLAGSSTAPLFRTKSIDALIAASEEPGKRLRQDSRALEPDGARHWRGHRSGIFTLTGTAAAGKPTRSSPILNAPVLDLLLHGGNAVSTIGRPGAGPAISLSFCWWRSPAASRRSATPNWRR